jgi:hypothetical protein
MNWKDFLPITPTQWVGLLVVALGAAFLGGFLL